MNSPFKQKFNDKSPLAQKKAIERFVYNPKSDELTEKQRDSLHGVAMKNGKGFYSKEFEVSVDPEDGVLTNMRNPKHPDFKSQIYSEKESPLDQRQLGNRGAYEATEVGDLIDETVNDESIYKSSNSGKISGMKYNVQDISEIQEDEDGQFMVSLGDDEAIQSGPNSNISIDGRETVRDTLRPAVGRKFYNPKK
jgi:hypothetical protein